MVKYLCNNVDYCQCAERSQLWMKELLLFYRKKVFSPLSG